MEWLVCFPIVSLMLGWLILYENDVKLLKFKRSPVRSICDMFEVWDFDYWLLI